jgi:predicted permease
MRQDIRSALRLIRRDPGFAAAVILTLAIGIGANTAIFSVVNSVLLRPLQYREPGRLVTVNEMVPKVAHIYPELPVNLSHYFDWKKAVSSFESIALVQSRTMNVTGGGEPELLNGARISANTFEVLGAKPALGRPFLEREERKGQDRVLILAHKLWSRRYHSDPGIIGRKVLLDGNPYDVVGVLPEGFRFPNRSLGGQKFVTAGLGDNTEFYIPLGYDDEDLKNRFGEFNYSVFARLRPAIPAEKALSELNVVQSRISLELPEKMELRALVKPLQEAIVGDARLGLLVVMGAVAAVLLVLCVNLANLWFARAAGRGQELAVRVALGASRGTLMRQMLTESLVLSTAGGVLGCVIAYAGLNLLLRFAPLDLPRLAEVRVDGVALAFAVGISVVSGVLFGVVPAWKMARNDPQEALKTSSRSSTEGGHSIRTRNLLVAAEVGLCTMLLIGAGLLIRSFDRLMNVNRGFQVERVLAVDIALPSTKYEGSSSRTRFYRNLLDKARVVPGVESVSITSFLPFQGEIWVDSIGRENDSRPIFQRPLVNVRFVSPEYFQTLAIPLLVGRTFMDSDRERQVTILSQALANKLWPRQDPVGRKVLRDKTLIDVVGVTPDLRSTSLDKDPVNMMYVPYWQRSRYAASLLVRTANDPRSVASVMRRAIWDLDAEVPVPAARTLVEVMNASVAQRRFQTMLILGFAAAALGLASLGVYGVLAYNVARRRNEIGVRMALGADASNVRAMVLRQGLTPVVLGLAAGLASSLALGKVLSSMLFQVTPRDPLTMVLVVAVLGTVAVAACVVPAVRATRIDPVRALRCE